MSKKYEIKTLKDILEIPEDRMDAFVSELKIWHQQAHAWSELLTATAETLGVAGEIDIATQGMTWTDDGKSDIRINLLSNTEDAGWTKFTDDYEKVFYAVKLPDGTVVPNCWPNAGKIRANGKSYTPEDNILVRKQADYIVEAQP